MKEDLCMWEYWRDDKGFETAIEEYFSKTVQEDEYLRIQYQNYLMSKYNIDQRMKLLTKEAENDHSKSNSY